MTEDEHNQATLDPPLQSATVTRLVGRQKPEVFGRVRDDVALGVRVDGYGARQVAEPIDSDAENAELAQRVDEQLAVRTVRLHGTTTHALTDHTHTHTQRDRFNASW